MNKSFFLMIGCIISQHTVLAILPEPEVDKYCDEKPVAMALEKWNKIKNLIDQMDQPVLQLTLESLDDHQLSRDRSKPFIILDDFTNGNNDHDSLILRINQECTISLLTGIEKTTGEPLDWCWLEEESAGLLVLEKKEVVWPPVEFFIWFPSTCYTFKAVKPGQGMLVFARPNKDSDSKQAYWTVDFMVSE